MTLEERVFAIITEKSIVRARDIVAKKIPRVTLTRLLRNHRVVRLARGLYGLPDADVTENHSLAEISKRIPNAIICLLSALRFHGLTTQSSAEIWIALDRKRRKPTMKGIRLRVVRFSGKMSRVGVDKIVVENVPIYVTSIARTVADCFKYRNKIGLDVALEALRAYRQMRGSRDALWRAAKVCRVASVMRPYMEAIE